MDKINSIYTFGRDRGVCFIYSCFQSFVYACISYYQFLLDTQAIIIIQSFLTIAFSIYSAKQKKSTLQL